MGHLHSVCLCMLQRILAFQQGTLVIYLFVLCNRRHPYRIAFRLLTTFSLTLCRKDKKHCVFWRVSL